MLALITYFFLFYTVLAIALVLYMFIYIRDCYRRGWIFRKPKENTHYVDPANPHLNLNQMNMFGQTPLMGVVQNAKSAEMVERLLEKSDVNVADPKGMTALMRAAEFNTNPAIMAALVSSGANVHATEHEGGKTALMIAAAKNTSAGVMKILLAAGSQVNMRDLRGKTALMYAAQRNPNPEIITLLLSAGSDKALKSYSGKTAYDYAHENVEIYKTKAYYDLEVR